MSNQLRVLLTVSIGFSLVFDPEACNRNAGNGLNYDIFCGFYEVDISQMI